LKKIVIIGLIFSIGIISAVFGAYVYELLIPGTVIVLNTPTGEYEVQAFEDSTCTIPLTSVDWGELQPGEIKQIDFYLKNTGNVTISSVTVEVVSDVQYSGGHGYGTLEPQQSMKAAATLKISPTAVSGQYSAEIKVTCTA